jgi:hypothetical protein
LFDGSVNETGSVSSQLRLDNGARVLLAAGSRGIVYRDRMVLEKGGSRIDRWNEYALEALSLKIQTLSPDTSANVTVSGPERVHVTALAGAIRVSNPEGILLARVRPGEALTLATQAAGASAPSVLTGCLESSGGRLLLLDEASSVSFVLIGGDAGRYAGSRVEVLGTVKPNAGESNQVQVNRIRQLSKRCAARGAAAGAAESASARSGGTAGKTAGTAAKTAGAAGKTAGMSVATKAVIAGVVVAGAATGGAIAAVQSDDSSDISPSTR